MKTYHVVALALAALCSVSMGATKKTPAPLGNVLYIGDSITHGFGAPSYRWALHKIFVDNGIEYDEIGIETGNKKGGVDPGIVYLGRSFKNEHAAMSSERAYEVSNRMHPSGGRLNDTSVFHWLDLDKDAEGKEVTPVENRKLSATPDTCFILLGTNDLLSDGGKSGNESVGKLISTVEKALLDKKKGDMCVIVNAIRQKNPKAKIVILTVPTWSNTTNNKSNTSDKDYKAVVKSYNKKLASTFKKETVVDVNQGLVDFCDEEQPLRAVPSFFSDKLHPSRQGDLIMAGLVARALGYAGRSAGATRAKAETFSCRAATLLSSATENEKVEAAGEGLSLPAGAKLVAPWPEESDTTKGFCAEIAVNVGNGATGGWEKEGSVTLSVGNGKHSGQLKLAEGYIMWNKDRILYPVNMSDKKLEPIRVTWIPGSAAEHVDKGFYVWLGDMLIGEGLPDDGAKFNGIGIENVSTRDEVVKSLSAEANPFAPVSGKGYIKEEVGVVYDEEPAAK